MAEQLRNPPGITQGDIGPRYTRKRLADEVYIGHYIKAGDRLRIRATIATGVIASLTTVNLTIGGRVQGMDGELVPFSDSFTFSADGVQTAQYVMAPEGYVVDLIVQSTTTGLGATDFIVVVDIVQGVSSNAIAVGLLAFGYVYPAGLLGLNVLRNISAGAAVNMSIGGVVSGGTAGSVLFVGTGPVLAQDNSNLNWNDANNKLTVQSGVAGNVIAEFGTVTDHSSSVGIGSVNEMQVLGEALGIYVTDDGGNNTVNMAGLLSFVTASHASTTLTNLYGVNALVRNLNNGGTVTNLIAVRANITGTFHTTNAIGLLVENVTSATNNYAIQTGAGMVSLGDVLKLSSVAIASLPATPATGMVMGVTDSLAPVIGSTVASGGAAPALVWYNGANWKVFAV